ncbi:MAG: tol-pal system protein YbgF [Pseudomonadota bacterium]
MAMSLRQPLHRLTPIAIACCLAVVTPYAAAESPIEQRVQRLERILDNRVLIDLLQRIEGLQREVRELRGEIELQRNELTSMDQRNRDLYIDTDRRLQDIENQNGAASTRTDELPGDDEQFAAAAGQSGAAGAATGTATQGNDALIVGAAAQVTTTPSTSALLSQPAATDPAEKTLFDSAYLDLVNGRYNAATAGFEKLIGQYPNGAYNAGALYWMGEAQYAQREFDQARSYFDQLLVLYPTDKKAPDARLKVGFVQHELGDLDSARETLKGVVSRHPGTTAALLAERRLSEIGE